MDVRGASVSPLVDGLSDPGRAQDNPSIVLPHQKEIVSHIALDLGGSLVKLAYFARSPGGGTSGGKLRFEKFETTRIEECMEFIERKRLHRHNNSSEPIRVKATGGGAFKYADLFMKRLGIILEREDEMACMVAGCNFLLQAVRNEAFEYGDGELTFKEIEPATMYPYLLVNIGSGVSMVRVDNENSFNRVSGTNIGGGTFWGLARLLTGCSTFDEILQLSSHGDNSKVDMLVGDIYGGRDYTSIGLAADTIASSFGKVLHSEKRLGDYNKADIAMSLCRMISYNIGQLAYLNAKRYGLSRIFFGGFFIRGHPYTMEIISYAIKFWSQGEMGAMFLRHEGFLGAMGAFMQVQNGLQSAVTPVKGLKDVRAAEAAVSKVRARFVEKFDDTTLNASASGTVSVSVTPKNGGADTRKPPFDALEHDGNGEDGRAGLEEREGRQDRVEREEQREGQGEGDERGEAVQEREREPEQALAHDTGTNTTCVGTSHQKSRQDNHQNNTWMDKFMATAQSATAAAKSEHDLALARKKSLIDLQVGVLHFTPTSEPFPLLSQRPGYKYAANTIDINADAAEMAYWVGILQDQLPTVMEKAASSQGNSKEAVERAALFGQSLDACLSKYRSHRSQSSTVDRVELSDLFEVREELLREAGFQDVYRMDKERENAAALEALEALLIDLDKLDPPARLLSLVEGALAANIFDWGAKACVDMYHTATILDMYRDARVRLSTRPWRVDDFDDFAESWLAKYDPDGTGWNGAATGRDGWKSPYRRTMIFVDNAGADVVLGVMPIARELLRGGGEVILAANSLPAINDITCEELTAVIDSAAGVCPIIKAAWANGKRSRAANGNRVPPPKGMEKMARAASVNNLSFLSVDSVDADADASAGADGSGGGEEAAAANVNGRSLVDRQGSLPLNSDSPRTRLYVVENGQGSPCLDLSRVSKDVADATVGCDLVMVR